MPHAPFTGRREWLCTAGGTQGGANFLVEIGKPTTSALGMGQGYLDGTSLVEVRTCAPLSSPCMAIPYISPGVYIRDGKLKEETLNHP